MNFSKICVLGLGYIGLPTASTFARCGMDVVGVDTNPKVVESLKKRILHIKEPVSYTHLTLPTILLV